MSKASVRAAYVEDDERSTVASRESGDGLENAVLSSRSFTIKTISRYQMRQVEEYAYEV